MGESLTAKEVQKWFEKAVTYEGEAYTVDLEQAAAIADMSKNAIVVARAGSGKTRTIVAKIVYLVAKCGMRPEEIMAFVFNANAAAEINARLLKMRVEGEPVMGRLSGASEGPVGSAPEIASTFHAFARKIVYDVCKGRAKCGEILAEEKDAFLAEVVARMWAEPKWQKKITAFVEPAKKMSEREFAGFVKTMAQFVNRAQQRFLTGEGSLKEAAAEYLACEGPSQRERQFIELGAECYRRYHWYLLNVRGRASLPKNLQKYGTDFNLLIAWASQLILQGRVAKELKGKKLILIDEYQDFSQLFLSVVEAIRENCKEAKLFVVGDDWQAINRFAGSDVAYFKDFEKFFPEDARRLTISTNYRCNYMIVDTARKFMKKAMGEKGEFRAFSRKAGQIFLVQPADYIETAAKLVRENKKAKEILILHRNNEMESGMALEELKAALLKRLPAEFEKKISVMTMHKSKGLEAEVVIILEADEGVIPRSHPDTRLYQLFGETEEVALDDQKRLLYVAMTRAKKRLYIIHRHTDTKPDGFMKFLGRNYEKWEE